MVNSISVHNLGKNPNFWKELTYIKALTSGPFQLRADYRKHYQPLIPN